MAKKTSAEMAREQSEIAKVEGMPGDAFGSLGGLEQPVQDEKLEENIQEQAMIESETELQERCC